MCVCWDTRRGEVECAVVWGEVVVQGHGGEWSMTRASQKVR